MNNITISGLGGMNLPIGGYGEGVSAEPVISPSSGTMAGGTAITILDSGINLSTYTDYFPSPTLNASLWNDVSVSGTVDTLNDRLALNVPASGGLAAISSVFTFKYINADIRLSHLNTNANRAQQYTVFSVALVLDPGVDQNYIGAKVLWHPSFGYLLEVSSVTDGTPAVLYKYKIPERCRSINVRRVLSSVKLTFDNSIVCDIDGWSDQSATLVLGSESAAAILAQENTVYVNSFVVSPMVVFGTEAADAARADGARVLCVTPKYTLPTTVDVYTYTLSTVVELGQFLFTPTVGLELDDTDVLLVDNDSALRNRSSV